MSTVNEQTVQTNGFANNPALFIDSLVSLTNDLVINIRRLYSNCLLPFEVFTSIIIYLRGLFYKYLMHIVVIRD